MVRFISKMFHPNVYADGSICLDILQNRWSPTYDVSSILVRSLTFFHPNNEILDINPIITRRAESKLSSKLAGRPAVSRESPRVREKSNANCRTELEGSRRIEILEN